MNKKNKTRASFITTLFFALGIGGGFQAKESQEYISTQIQSAGEYVQTTQSLNYLEQLENQFLGYAISKEHTDLKNLYVALTKYDFEKMNLDQFKGFRDISFATLKELQRVQHQYYEKGTPKYNEIESRVIPEVVEYISTGLSILKKRFPNNKEVSQMIKMTK